MAGDPLQGWWQTEPPPSGGRLGALSEHLASISPEAQQITQRRAQGHLQPVGVGTLYTEAVRHTRRARAGGCRLMS